MSPVMLIVLAIGLSMDVFIASMGKGMLQKKMSYKTAVLCGLWFGIFQAGMPALGFLAGTIGEHWVGKSEHWFFFLLILFIGINIIRESVHENLEETEIGMDAGSMLIQSIATSIDAFAVGVAFVFTDTSLYWGCSIIGVVAFVFSVLGVKVGNSKGTRYRGKAGIFGGILLIFLSILILLEQLDVVHNVI